MVLTSGNIDVTGKNSVWHENLFNGGRNLNLERKTSVFTPGNSDATSQNSVYPENLSNAKKKLGMAKIPWSRISGNSDVKSKNSNSFKTLISPTGNSVC